MWDGRLVGDVSERRIGPTEEPAWERGLTGAALIVVVRRTSCEKDSNK